MKIYDDKQGAPNPRRVRIFLAEKGIDVPYEQVPLASGGHKTPEFLAKNPMGQIPVLELDDGTCISESVAICRYFEELHPDPPLFGRGAEERARVEMWQRRIELNLSSAVGQVWVHTHPITEALFKRNPDLGLVPQKEWGVFNRRRARSQMDFLDGVLAKTEFIAGDTYSIADISTLCTLDFGRALLDLPIPEEQENLSRWYAAVSARPSASA
jgi:glutathione S-transferase